MVVGLGIALYRQRAWKTPLQLFMDVGGWVMQVQALRVDPTD